MLTETKARAIKPGDKNLADGTVVGLWLRPGAAKGKGAWNLRYVSPVTRKRRDMGLGAYPDVSIADAREKGNEARLLIAKGQDPIEAKKEAERLAKAKLQCMTFEQAARQTHEHKKPGWRNRKQVDQWLNTLVTYAFPVIGSKPVESLQAEDFRQVLEPIWLDKSETASRVKQRCKAVMDWCIAQKLISANPTSVVQFLLPKAKSKRERTEHHPAMPWEKVPFFVREILRDGTTGTCREAMEFLILSATRSGEVRFMEWNELNHDWTEWTIPATRMKAGVEHKIPVTWRMNEILQHQKSLGRETNLVFPAPRGREMSDNTLSKFLRDHKAKSADGRNAVVHGFRSSFRDWGAENGFDDSVLEACLAHSIRNPVVAAYKRTTFFEKRREVMTTWTEFVCGERAEIETKTDSLRMASPSRRRT